MTLARFLSAMNDAAGRALADGLNAADLRLIRDTCRAWDSAGRPPAGPLHEARTIAFRVFRFDALREARERTAREAEVAKLEKEVAQLKARLSKPERAA